MKNNLLGKSLINSLGVVVYVFIVSLIMQNGQKLFGNMNNLFGPFAFLLLFVLSAAIVGSLVLGKPIIMYLNGDKRDALKLFSYTILWLFIVTLIVLLLHVIF